MRNPFFHFLGLVALLFAAPVSASEKAVYGGDSFQSTQGIDCGFVVAWGTVGNIEYDRKILTLGDADPYLDGAAALHDWDPSRRLEVWSALQVLAQHANDTGLKHHINLVPPASILGLVQTSHYSPRVAENFRVALEILRTIPAKQLLWGEPLLAHGTAANFPALMASVGADFKVALEAMSALRATAAMRANDPLTAKVVRSLFSKSDPAIVCVVGGGCRIEKHVGAFAYYSHVTGPQLLVRYAAPVGRAFYPRNVPEVGWPRLVQFLVIPRPEISGVEKTAYWAAAYAHELTHWHDAKFISAWLRANQRRINRGEQPDLLFQAHVRIFQGADGMEMTIDSGFRMALFESRAYRVHANVYEGLRTSVTNEWRRENDRNSLARKGYDYVMENGGKSVLELFGCREFNANKFFDVGMQIAALMEATIRDERLEVP